MSVPLSVFLTTRKDAHRLPSFLKHATQWADEVLILEKDADFTMDVSPPVRFEYQACTPQGHEDMVENLSRCTHDWVFVMTAGEVPTREFIDKLKVILTMYGSQCDIITVPKKLYSFGIHDEASPWSIGQQPMVINRKRALISNRVHQNFSLRPGGKCVNIPYSPTCHVLHPTHTSAEAFLRSHIEYAMAEAEADEPEKVTQEALQQINSQDFGKHKQQLFGQECAWKLYWLAVMLCAHEKKARADTAGFYKSITETMLAKEWA